MKRAWILVGLLGLIGCGGAQPVQPTGARIAASEFAYSPATLTIPAGETTTLTVRNAGQTLHDWTIVDGPGIPADAPVEQRAYRVVVEPGVAATIELDLPPGVYGFVCTVDGHEKLGMVGTLTVE